MRYVLAAAALAFCLAAAAQDRLPALGADAAPVTVSGISSGGYMAVQVQVAHSALVRGAGVLAAGPYYCAQNSAVTAYYNCMTPGTWTQLPGLAILRAQTDQFARAGAIDPVANLAAARVWLFSGTNDRTVDRSVVAALRDFYVSYRPPPGAVVLVEDRPAGHAMITLSAGGACPVTQPPFINDCDFDAAEALLQHLLGPLEPPAEKETGRVLRFDQREHAAGDAYAISLADSAYAYVPRACEAGGCRVHVALHGCRQSVEAIGERFVREAGYNRWADSNRLVVLYPQTVARNGWGVSGWRWTYVFNPRGCWDWWGYTGPQYATKQGPQVRAVKSMVDRLASRP